MSNVNAPEKYIRLTGKKRTWTGFSQAWLCTDHLLIVQSSRFVERYRRFALSDIQAIVVTEGGRRAIAPVIAVLLCLAFGIISTSTFARAFFGVIGSIALAFAIVDIARGPRCRCFLQTAVSRERLSCISRMRTARSFLAAIGPAIESVQGSIRPEDLAPAPSSGFSTDPSSTSVPQPPALERKLPYAPEVLFTVLVLDSVLMFVALRSTVGVALSILPVIYFAEFLIGILALIQSRTRKAMLLTVLVAAFLCVLLDPFVLSGVAVWPSVVTTFRETLTGLPSWNIPVGAPVNTRLLATAWRAAIAIAGLLVCYFERTAERA